MAGESRHTGVLHRLGQGMESKCRDISAHIRLAKMQILQHVRLLVVVLTACLQVKLPAITADGHLHDLGGALIDDRDTHVTLDLLHHVLVRITVAAECLDAGFCCEISGFGCHVFGDRTFGVQTSFTVVDALRRLFYIGASGLQPYNMRNNQLVGVSLFFRERRSSLDTLS